MLIQIGVKTLMLQVHKKTLYVDENGWMDSFNQINEQMCCFCNPKTKWLTSRTKGSSLGKGQNEKKSHLLTDGFPS
jgi:hypothetical protein